MAYCRWSTDDFGSDVYVFSDLSGGWTTMVSETRYVEGLEFVDGLPVIPKKEGDDFIDVMERYSDYQVPIDIEGAGSMYNDPTIEECIKRLEDLKARGFRVPQIAFDRLRKEQAEEAQQ